MSSPTPTRKRRYGAVRQTIEFIVYLGLAVSICKSFAFESYMIETGSMAPGLYGWHRKATCPQCGWSFAIGVARTDGDLEAVCPNCDHAEIPVPAISAETGHSTNTAGDRVMVHKWAFDQHPLRRWEIAVFRNPQRMTENYFKRIVGLPGETVQIRDGDLYINGKIARKSLTTQRQMRIPVFDNDFPPKHEKDTARPPQWRPLNFNSNWTAEGNSFLYASSETINAPLDRLVFQRWIQQGSLKTNVVPLTQWPEGAAPPDPYFSNVTYDADQQTLICLGVMTSGMRDRLLKLSADDRFRQAVQQLYHDSHTGVVTDRYGYNGPSGELPVRDIMLSLELQSTVGEGEFVMRLTDGLEIVDCRFDFSARTIELFGSQSTEPIWQVPFPSPLSAGSCLVEMSLIDHQCLVAINGVQMAEAWTYKAPETPPPTPTQPVELAASGVALKISHLQLFRDVYYRSKPTEVGYSPYVLGEDEYFALGDNSPISEDSRVWLSQTPPGRLTSRHFIGRPFLVHLPSKRWGTSISIPDVSRMRYIR